MENGDFYHEAAPETNFSYESNDNVYEASGDIIQSNDATSEMNAKQLNDNAQQWHPPLKDLLKKEYSHFKDIEKFSKGLSYWRLNEISKRRPDKEAHVPTKRKKREVVARLPLKWSESEIESEDDKNWKYKPLNTAVWNPEDNLLPQYRKNAFKDIKPNFFDHYGFSPNLRTWGKNAGRPRSLLCRSQRILDLLDTSDNSSGKEDQSVSKSYHADITCPYPYPGTNITYSVSTFTNFVEKLY